MRVVSPTFGFLLLVLFTHVIYGCKGRTMSKNQRLQTQKYKTTDDAFIDSCLRSNLSYTAIKPHYLRFTKNETTNDSVLPNEETLYSTSDTFIFIKNDNNVFLKSAIIRSKLTVLDRSVIVGMSKGDFLNNLNISDSIDNHFIELSNIEEHCIFKFFFESDTLSHVAYNLTYID